MWGATVKPDLYIKGGYSKSASTCTITIIDPTEKQKYTINTWITFNEKQILYISVHRVHMYLLYKMLPIHVFIWTDIDNMYFRMQNVYCYAGKLNLYNVLKTYTLSQYCLLLLHLFSHMVLSIMNIHRFWCIIITLSTQHMSILDHWYMADISNFHISLQQSRIISRFY